MAAPLRPLAVLDPSDGTVRRARIAMVISRRRDRDIIICRCNVFLICVPEYS